MWKTFGAFALMWLTACEALDPPHPATNPRFRSVIADMQACHNEQAALLDDQMSDARTIGRSVSNACRSYADEAVRIATSGTSYAYADGFTSSFRSQVVDDATQAVLRARNRQRLSR